MEWFIFLERCWVLVDIKSVWRSCTPQWMPKQTSGFLCATLRKTIINLLKTMKWKRKINFKTFFKSLKQCRNHSHMWNSARRYLQRQINRLKLNCLARIIPKNTIFKNPCCFPYFLLYNLVVNLSPLPDLENCTFTRPGFQWSLTRVDEVARTQEWIRPFPFLASLSPILVLPLVLEVTRMWLKNFERH